MIKSLKSLVFLGTVLSPLSAVAEETDKVMEAFKGYKSAILGQQGEEAAGWVTKGTLEEYGRYVDWALTADRKTVDELTFINRFQLLMLRHRVPMKTLRQATGQSIFVYAVDNDWIGKNGVIRTEIGSVKIAEERATAVAMINGEATPIQFQFQKEDGKWRLDLVALTKATAPALKAAVTKSGMEENEFIFTMLETVSDKKPADSLWTPPGKDEAKKE